MKKELCFGYDFMYTFISPSSLRPNSWTNPDKSLFLQTQAPLTIFYNKFTEHSKIERRKTW
jgi:hypothetical protein